MSNIQDPTARQNGDPGNEVGTCFITSKSYPDLNFLISMVDLPKPSDGFTYSFSTSFVNGSLYYDYESDPNANPNEFTTYVMPPFPCSATEMNGGTIQQVTVQDQSKTKPKTGQVSNIQFAGKFELPHHTHHLAIENEDTTPPTQSNWVVNLFIINSQTQTQSFGIVTCPINPNLDGYNGPYDTYINPDIASGNVNVTPVRASSPDSGQINQVIIGVAAAPLNTDFTGWQVSPGGAVTSTDNVEGNYQPNYLSSTNPTTTL